MSRGFVKEGDQEEVPMVPPRAYIPDGVPNYVTRNGMNELLEEKQRLIEERENHNSINENERRIAVNHINARLILLNNRIDGAIIVNHGEKATAEVKFGAVVTLRTPGSEKLQTFRIVGVDEADISKGKISFISPLAKVLINKKKGDKTILKLAKEDKIFEIVNISYQ